MEIVFKKALDQIKADEDLKKKTAEYVLNADLNITSIKNVAAYKRKPAYIKRLVAAACIAAVLCAVPIGAYAYYKTPASYISVDINPSVELGINAFGKVVSVKAYNADGETVITGLSLLNTDTISAVNLIVTSASQNGFIHDDGSTFIAVTAETNNEALAEELEEDAQTGAENAIKSEGSTATVLTDNIALARRDEALALGITPGKLNLIQKLQALDPAIETQDYKDASVSEIQKKFIELKKENKGNSNKDETDEAVSPDAPQSVSASPDSQKPGNGKHNGNGNKKDQNAPASPSTNDSAVDEVMDSLAPSDGNDANGGATHSNNGNNNNGKNNRSDDNKDNGDRGKGNN